MQTIHTSAETMDSFFLCIRFAGYGYKWFDKVLNVRDDRTLYSVVMDQSVTNEQTANMDLMGHLYYTCKFTINLRYI